MRVPVSDTYDLWHTSTREAVGHYGDPVSAHRGLRLLGAGHHMTAPDGTVLAVRVRAEQLAFVPYPDARYLAPEAFGEPRPKRVRAERKWSPFHSTYQEPRFARWGCGWTSALGGAYADMHPAGVA
jgi:hypothetical protein